MQLRASSGRVSIGSALAALLASSAVPAIEVNLRTEDFTLRISPQLQPRFEADFDGPPGAASPSGHANFDFFIRRARLLVSGSAYKQFTFAILLNAVRLGERGNFNVAPFLQDLFVGYVPATDVNIEMGFLYMPLTHAALGSATDASALEGLGSRSALSFSSGGSSCGAGCTRGRETHRPLPRSTRRACRSRPA